MKTFLPPLIVLFFYLSSNSQTVFWTENFGTGCNTGQLASSYSGVNGARAVASTGANGVDGNLWYVSAEENGNGDGNCGTGCGTNRTLHISSNASVAGDIGAAYEVGCVPGCFVCDVLGPPFCLYSTANLRAESPVINCSGRTAITLAFNYMEYGDGTNDDATLWYYNGASWAQLVNLIKTACCGGPCDPGPLQGQWTAYSTTLPTSANNNANVKIGFNWTNNDDAVGWDPSFAVDDITLSVATMPVELLSFTASHNGTTVDLKWSTASEQNADYFTVQRSADGKTFFDIVNVNAAGNSSSLLNYYSEDKEPLAGISYYRLRETDFDGTESFSQIVSVKINSENDLTIENIFSNNGAIYLSVNCDCKNGFDIEILDVTGKKAWSHTVSNPSSKTEIKINAGNFAKGIYLVKASNEYNMKSKKFLINN